MYLYSLDNLAMASTPITAAHRAKLTQLLADFGSKRFRRSDLEKLMYPLTNPRSHDRANMIAEAVIREAAAKGQVRREGHVHWQRVDFTRKTLEGRVVPELAAPMALTLNTKVPAKWASIDLETGQVYMGTERGWANASAEFLAELKTALKKG